MSQVKTDIQNNIATVTLDSPPVNALNQELLTELKQVIDDLSANKEVRAVVITGNGNHAFCAGADLKALGDVGPEGAQALIDAGHATFNAIEDSPKPFIAAINNLALGGGCELAMACDMRIASDRARMGQPEVWFGLIPAWGGSTRLPKLISPGKAKELIFTGQMINAQEAQRIGLVDKIVPDGEEVRAAVDIARMIARKAAPLAVSHAKQVMNQALDQNRTDSLQNERNAIGELAQSKDLIEGITAFIEKRQPEFKGE